MYWIGLLLEDLFVLIICFLVVPCNDITLISLEGDMSLYTIITDIQRKGLNKSKGFCNICVHSVEYMSNGIFCDILIVILQLFIVVLRIRRKCTMCTMSVVVWGFARTLYLLSPLDRYQKICFSTDVHNISIWRHIHAYAAQIRSR